MFTVAIEAVGWLAAILTLVAYGLLSSGRLRGDDPKYQGMNIAGAVGLIANAAWNGALPVAALNLAWALVGIWALFRIAHAKRHHPLQVNARRNEGDA